jgi:hypothetical protein
MPARVVWHRDEPNIGRRLRESDDSRD